MARNPKYSLKQKVWACEQYLSGHMSALKIAHTLNMPANGERQVHKWILKYQRDGIQAFQHKSTNNCYTKEIKNQVVIEYLSGFASAEQLALKYNISGDAVILKWVSKYNNRLENKDYCPQPEVYMAPTRKTTLEERIEIAKYCLENGKNYKETASKYNCSYSQVYNWTQKYLKDGEEALKDNRGRAKPEEELTEEEKTRRKLAAYERRIQELEMENEVLKKAEEWERRAIGGWRLPEEFTKNDNVE